MICTGLMSRKHSSDCDPAPVKGSWYPEPDYAPSATGHLELQLRACGTVCHPLSLQPAHSRLSKDNWKLFFSRTHFLSFSCILIVYRVLEAFSLSATLIFTFNNNNNNKACLRHDHNLWSRYIWSTWLMPCRHLVFLLLYHMGHTCMLDVHVGLLWQDIVTVVISHMLISLLCFPAELFIWCEFWNADDDVQHGDTAAEDDCAADTSQWWWRAAIHHLPFSSDRFCVIWQLVCISLWCRCWWRCRCWHWGRYGRLTTVHHSHLKSEHH